MKISKGRLTALHGLIAVGKKMMKTARRVAIGAQGDKIGR